MPWRGFRGSGFLHQHMIVEQLHRVRAHQISGNLCRRRLTDHGFKFGDARPIAVIVKETPCLTGFQIFGGKFARFRHVARNPFAQGLDMVGKQPPDQHDAIALVGRYIRRADQRVCHGVSFGRDRGGIYAPRFSGQSRSNSLIEVFERVCASTFFTITAQYRLIPFFEGIEPATTTDPAGTSP